MPEGDDEGQNSGNSGKSSVFLCFCLTYYTNQAAKIRFNLRF